VIGMQGREKPEIRSRGRILSAFRESGFRIPVDKSSGSSHENPRSCETRNSMKGRFDNSVSRGSGTREDSVLGSRVLDSRYPKVRNHVGPSDRREAYSH
jgi:hypothetical protein